MTEKNGLSFRWAQRCIPLFPRTNTENAACLSDDVRSDFRSVADFCGFEEKLCCSVTCWAGPWCDGTTSWRKSGTPERLESWSAQWAWPASVTSSSTWRTSWNCPEKRATRSSSGNLIRRNWPIFQRYDVANCKREAQFFYVVIHAAWMTSSPDVEV